MELSPPLPQNTHTHTLLHLAPQAAASLCFLLGFWSCQAAEPGKTFARGLGLLNLPLRVDNTGLNKPNGL